jgi:hypothetical protein
MTTDPQVEELDALATPTGPPSTKPGPDVAEAAPSEVETARGAGWNDGAVGCRARCRDDTVHDER